jgi:hypothetical protein
VRLFPREIHRSYPRFSLFLVSRSSLPEAALQTDIALGNPAQEWRGIFFLHSGGIVLPWYLQLP